MELKLTRCTIRNWRLDDAESLAKHANNRNVWLRLRDRFPHPYGIDDPNEFLKRATTKEGREKVYCIEIDGAAVGGIGLIMGEDVYRHTAEFGYWLSEDFWGRGIMTEAVTAFVDYCFANFQLNRIHAAAYANNPASARVLEKAGLILEGRLRKSVYKDGKILDSLLYAKTK